jgi:hypothetical protein
MTKTALAGLSVMRDFSNSAFAGTTFMSIAVVNDIQASSFIVIRHFNANPTANMLANNVAQDPAYLGQVSVPGPWNLAAPCQPFNFRVVGEVGKLITTTSIMNV